MVPGGFRSAYPGAALVTFLVSWAYEHGLHPEDVYQDYLARPKGYHLLAAYSQFQAEENDAELQKKRKMEEIRNRHSG